MGCGRALLCIIFPPLAVIDRGCGTVIIVLLLTLAGWIPGAIAAVPPRNSGTEAPAGAAPGAGEAALRPSASGRRASAR